MSKNLAKPYVFEINGESWKIIELSQIGDEVTTLGETEYHTRTIALLEWVDKTTKIRTLRHELCHVWLWEYGHNQQEKEFNHEDVCEIVASSSDFINKVVLEYFKREVNE